MLRRAIEIEPDAITLPDEPTDGQARAYAGLANIASRYLEKLRTRIAAGLISPRAVLVGRVRGTGTGVSFGRFLDMLEGSKGLALQSPFEGSPTVAGAVLEGRHFAGPERDDAFLKLRFDAGSDDLPMHAHEGSDRFIFVLSGRGCYHISPDPLDGFTGCGIAHVPVRERDVLMFPRDTIHTFSTDPEALLLLSYHAPYIPLDDPKQYTLPSTRVAPARLPSSVSAQVACDPAWTCVA